VVDCSLALGQVVVEHGPQGPLGVFESFPVCERRPFVQHDVVQDAIRQHRNRKFKIPMYSIR
jgi:hypothetical protein